MGSDTRHSSFTPHFATILTLGISASFWAVFSERIMIPLGWLIAVSAVVFTIHPAEFTRFMHRFLKIGLTLVAVSVLQIVFRREGAIILSIESFHLIYENGLREAVLLWIRFMIIFSLAFLLARIS